MRTKRNGTFASIFTFLFLLFLQSAWAQQAIKAYELPASKSSGLTKFFFRYTPLFWVDKWKDHAVLYINLQVIGSTAGNVQGGFWYNYRYNGKDYGDNAVGRDVFEAISIDMLKFRIQVHGNGAIYDLTYDKTWGQKEVAKVPLTAKASDYTVFIGDLVSVDFKGTAPIEKRIQSLVAEERQKELDALTAEKKKAEEAAIQKQASEQKKKDEEAKSTAPNNTTSSDKTSSSAVKEDDFWETGKKAVNSGSSPTNNTTDRAQKIAQQQEEAKKEKAAADQKAVDDFFAKQKADQAQAEKEKKELQQRLDLQDRSFQASSAADQARADMRENTKLEGGYKTEQELMAEFRQRMANINRASDLALQKSNEALNARVDVSTSGGSAEMQAYGSTLKAVGSILNSAQEASARKRAQASLRAEKERMLKQMADEKKRMLTQVRTDLFSRFKEGAFPLSSTRLEAATIYYFVYAYDPQQLGADQPLLYVSNVFPISRYSDGTWPFKNTVATDVAKLTPYSEVMHGFYTSKEEAEARRKAMINVFTQTGGSTNAVAYKGKATASAGTSAASGVSDFWETGKKQPADSTLKRQAKKDDFWNN